MTDAIGYAVLNVETDVFIKLGQHGPHLVDRATAEEQASGFSHLAVVAVTEATNDREALVRFYPQVWVDEQAVPAFDRDPAEYTVPLDHATTEGRIVEDDSRESDRLKDHENAPEWVREWSGPFYVEVEAQ